MENMTMNPVSNWYAAMPSTLCATPAHASWNFAVQGVDVRDAVRATATAVKAAPKAAFVAIERDRAIATATGHAGLVAGNRPGSPAWSPPL